MNRRTTLICIVVLALVPVATALLHSHRADKQPAEAVLDTNHRAQPAATSHRVATPRPPAQHSNGAGADLPQDSGLLASIEYKYRFLFADLRLDATALERLKQWLVEYESVAQALERMRANDSESPSEEASRLQLRLDQIDTAIRGMLHPSDHAYYAALKDSDAEQQQLSQYMGGIGNVAPIGERQERAILKAKLLQKQRYEAVLRDSGLDRDTLSPAEREYAHATVRHALEQYRDEFLMQAAPSLTEEQYTLLSSFEITEFTHELERLQRIINAK